MRAATLDFASAPPALGTIGRVGPQIPAKPTTRYSTSESAAAIAA